MAKTPRKIELRSYQVGFGDCFLLSFVYGERDKRHVLIDFGTTGLPKSSKVKPSEHMRTVAEAIKRDCGGQLTAVVATHRHADHISGFATDGKSGKSGEIIRALKPKLVIQPWTEDPKAKPDAKAATTDTKRTREFVAGLASMHSIAAAVEALASKPPAWLGPSLAKELQFLGMDNIANPSAVENLIAMGKAGKASWVKHGDDPGLGRLLPGVKVHVLGPPSLRQTTRITKQTAKDKNNFWHLLDGSYLKGQHGAVVNGLATARKAAKSPVPPEARWFRDRLTRLRGQQLLEIVRSLDAQMNNTSVILLFEVGPKKLLFPGDAQIENWSYALEEAPTREKTRALLADVDLYKVGHHGSLNATPKKLLWDNFAKRTRATKKRLTTVLSTMPGKHGNPRSGTEVPRRPLVQALTAESHLWTTEKHAVNAEPVLVELTVKD